MPLQNLITPKEVILYSPAESSYPTSHLCSVINSREILLFDDVCLGLDFLDLLKADGEDFEGLGEYVDTSYGLGERIFYGDNVYESLINSNTSLPTVVTDWEVVDKFGTVHYQMLWDKHLKFILAFDVLYASIRYATFRANGHGVTEMEAANNTNLKTASRDTVFDYKRELRVDRDDRIRVMINWMKATNDTYAWQIAEVACGEPECNTKGRKTSRVSWR